MPRVSLTQGSQEWLEWRKDKITASDVAKIMNKSPYGTALSLWEEKTGRRPKQPFNPAMQFGSKMEPIIRKKWEEISGNGFMPCCYTHPIHDFIGASLDGLSFDKKEILEIKTCNKTTWDKAKAGNVVEWYEIQALVQLMCVPDAEYATMVFFNNPFSEEVIPESLQNVKIYPEKEKIDQILSAIIQFKGYLDEDKPPPHTKCDYHKEDSEQFRKAETSWIEAYRELQEAKKKEESLRKEMLNLADGRNIEGRYVKLAKMSRIGSVDWKSLCEEMNIQEEKLNEFRGDPVEYYKPFIKKA